jgi:hypothetical protein
MSEPSSPPGDRPGADAPGARNLIADVVQKAVLTGFGALFLTQESARRLAREWKLPKELAGYLVSQAQTAKDEALRVMGSEIRRFLESETLKREIQRILGSMAVEVNAEIRLKEPSRRARPSVRVRVRPRDRREGEKREGEGDAPR